jgi:hypothetical protein
LGQEVRFYMSQDKFERQLWQTPTEGRLIGKQVLRTVEPSTKVVFEDASGVRWNLHVSELTPMELELLDAGRMVRLVGTSSDLTTKQFHACGVFPWMLDKPVNMRELSNERQAFIERAYKHREKLQERPGEEGLARSFASSTASTVCADITLVQRIGPLKP